jgi:hypothetical protein
LLEPFKKKRSPAFWHRLTLVFLLATTLAVSLPAHPATADSGYTLLPATLLRAAAYGNGAYVVTGTYDSAATPSTIESVVLTSPDGTTWTAQPASSAGPTGDLAFGNGIFVSTGKYNDIATTLYSKDGVHWNSNILDRDLYSVVFGNGRFVLLGYTNNYTSTDGVNWTPIPNSAPFAMHQGDLIAGGAQRTLTYSNGFFIDIQGTQFATSTDGVNWQTHDLGLSDYSGSNCEYPSVTGAAYGNGRYVLVGAYNTAAGQEPVVITSQDAVRWTMTKLGDVNQLGQLENITFGNGLFVATGADGGLLTSTDGLHWQAVGTVAIPVDSGICQQDIAFYGTVSYCNDRFIALGAGGLISTSLDGVNWTNSKSAYRAVFTLGRSNYMLNGQTYPTDAAPFMENGRAFVPVRYLGDALGVNVNWWSGDPGTQTVSLTRYASPTVNFGVTLTIGSVWLTYQGSSITPGSSVKQMMDVAPLIINGRAYLPARYAARAFGYTVNWNPADRTVTIK